MKVLLYFGCPRSGVGHYLQAPGGDILQCRNATPWGNGIDGRLAPACDASGRVTEAQGLIAVHRKDGWTALAWWDRSQDTRPGSNSAIFVASPDIGPEAALALGRKQFPWVFKRMKFELVLPMENP